MEIVINETAPITWRNPTTLQVGLGAKSVIFENPKANQEKFIHALFSGLTLSQVRDYGRHLKLRSAEVQEIIQKVKPLLLTNTERVRYSDENGFTPTEEFESGEVAEPASLDSRSFAFQSALGEIASASLNLNARGESVWLRRQTRAVFISTLDRTGTLIAEALAAAGIGAIVTGDESAVGAGDIGGLGFHESQHGRSRFEIVSTKIKSFPMAPQLLKLTDLKQAQITTLDLAILLGQQLIEPQRFAAWMNRGVPQLGAIQAAASQNFEMFVSHAIEPGLSPCWVCFELNCQSQDQAWPNIASQLIGRETHFDSAAGRMRLAAEVASKTLLFLDQKNGYPPNRLNGMTTAEPSWAFNDECGCRLAKVEI